MVVVCSDTYPEDITVNEGVYEEHFNTFSFPLSPFQKHSIQAIVDGEHTLVTAHTGSGKTLPIEFAIRHFVRQGADNNAGPMEMAVGPQTGDHVGLHDDQTGMGVE